MVFEGGKIILSLFNVCFNRHTSWQLVLMIYAQTRVVKLLVSTYYYTLTVLRKYDGHITITITHKKLRTYYYYSVTTLLYVIKWLAVVYLDAYICKRKHMFWHVAQSVTTLLYVIKWLAVVYLDAYICKRKHMFWHVAQSSRARVKYM